MKKLALSTIQKIRQELIEGIKSILSEKGLTYLVIYDIDPGCTPVVSWDERDYNDDRTYTLDTIELKEGELFFDCSSCWDNRMFDEDTIPTDGLAEIYDFLVIYENKLKEG